MVRRIQAAYDEELTRAGVVVADGSGRPVPGGRAALEVPPA
jgi:hypothetical protein